MLNGKIIKVKPEFEDVRNAAIQANKPFLHVYNHINQEIQNIYRLIELLKSYDT